MAVEYVKVKRTVSVGNEPGEKYLARIYRGSDVELEQIANDISEATTISYPDVLACLKAMEIHISKYILSGQSVKFGILGSFIPTIHAKAQATPDFVTANTIKRFTCRFLPSVSFKTKFAKCSFREANLEVKGLID
jgi:predicted histone-like DNA-binding protein